MIAPRCDAHTALARIAVAGYAGLASALAVAIGWDSDTLCLGVAAARWRAIAMDLNGTVVKHEVLDGSARYTPSYDAGAIRVLESFCPPPPTRD